MEKNGSTMVEMIVSFALIGIFLVSAAAVMSTYFGLFTRVREYGDQQMLAVTLADTIQYELGPAEGGSYPGLAGAEENPAQMGVAVSADGSGISYKNADQIPSRIQVDGQGHLEILRSKAYMPENMAEEGCTAAVYGRNRIESLVFEPVPGEGKTQLVKVTLTLENQFSEELTCEVSRTVRCYNLEGDLAEECVHWE